MKHRPKFLLGFVSELLDRTGKCHTNSRSLLLKEELPLLRVDTQM